MSGEVVLVDGIAGGYESYSNAACRFPMITEPCKMIPHCRLLIPSLPPTTPQR